MESKVVLVTGIGGNVGQGILRNIMALHKPIRLIGTNTVEFTAGNHLVDAFYKIPFSYDVDFVSSIIKIVEEEKVNLIIPSTDYEAYYLSLHQASIPCKVACMDVEATQIYLDKYLTWQFHDKYAIPFAHSCLPSEYNKNYSKAIAKPRKGRGSRGLIKDVQEVSHLSDEEYMIQEQFDGLEITTAVYNKYTDGQFHGLITMERTLENGATTYCKVIKNYDAELEVIAKKMTEHLKLKGAFNIQSIVTADNQILPFEVNCRISGTNSIRSNFGFKDVAYTISELLYNESPEEVKVINGAAHRILMDVIYIENEPNSNLKGNNSDNFIVF